MAKAIKRNYKGGSGDASAIEYTKEDGTKSTVQDELIVVNDSLNRLNDNIEDVNSKVNNITSYYYDTTTSSLYIQNTSPNLVYDESTQVLYLQ